MNHKRFLVVLLVMALTLSLGSMALAAEGETVTLQRGQTVEDDFYAAGRIVTVMGSVFKDLIAAGEIVNSLGDVGGDVLAVGRNLNIDGLVNGNIRAAGQNVTVKAQVKRAVTVLGQQLIIEPEASIGHNLLFAGELLDLAGEVNGNVRGWASRVSVSGRVDGNLEIEAKQVEILSGAKVNGNVVVRGANPPYIEEGAEVEGQVDYIPVAPEESPALWQVIVEKLLALVKLVGLALLLALLAAPFVQTDIEVIRAKPWVGLAAGVGWLVLTPLAVILLTVMVVGQLVAWVLGVTYIGSLFLATLLFKPLLGALLGQWLLDRFGGGREFSLVWATLLGTVILWLVGLIPVVSGIITLLGLVFTLGSWLVLLARYGLGWPMRVTGAQS